MHVLAGHTAAARATFALTLFATAAPAIGFARTTSATDRRDRVSSDLGIFALRTRTGFAFALFLAAAFAFRVAGITTTFLGGQGTFAGLATVGLHQGSDTNPSGVQVGALRVDHATRTGASLAGALIGFAAIAAFLTVAARTVLRRSGRAFTR